MAALSRLTTKTNLPFIIQMSDGQRIILFTTNRTSCEIWFPAKEIKTDLKELSCKSHKNSPELFHDVSVVAVFSIIRKHGGLCEKSHPKGMPVRLNHGLTEIELIAENFDFAI